MHIMHRVCKYDVNFRITILRVAVTFYDFIYVACKMKICNVIIRSVPEAEYLIRNGMDASKTNNR